MLGDGEIMQEGSIIVRLVERIGGDLGHLLEVLLFLAVAVFAVASITEIAARGNYLGYLEGRVRADNEELAQNASNGVDKLTSDAISSLRKSRDYNKHLKGKVESLISVGADNSSQTLIAIRKASENSFFEPGASKPYTTNSVFYIIQVYINRLNSDYLLAIAIMTCGAIGASIGAIRTNRKFAWRSLLFGLSAGFIVFLAIKGGKHIFLLQEQGQIVQFNPYSSGFLGLIAGMFTEKTFELLTLVTDSIFNKVKKVIDE